MTATAYRPARGAPLPAWCGPCATGLRLEDRSLVVDAPTVLDCEDWGATLDDRLAAFQRVTTSARRHGYAVTVHLEPQPEAVTLGTAAIDAGGPA